MAIITKEEVLQRIKELRDAVNDIPDPTAVGWDANGVLAALDRAGDIIEFPNPKYGEGLATMVKDV